VTIYGGEIHTDVWGPSKITTLGGQHYYVSFTDDYSRETHLYMLKQKSEVFTKYQQYESWCLIQCKAPVKILQSDRGGEYMGEAFTDHLKAVGTIQKLTVHDTPQQNGVAECLNHTLMEWVHTVLHASGLPHYLWGEAVRHICWLKNHTSTKALPDKTPYEVATGIKPDLSCVHEWGSIVWVHNPADSKLDP